MKQKQTCFLFGRSLKPWLMLPRKIWPYLSLMEECQQNISMAGAYSWEKYPSPQVGEYQETLVVAERVSKVLMIQGQAMV